MSAAQTAATASMSDKARSIFAFAAYYALLSGDPVREVVLDDGQGHHADADGVKELQSAGLIEPQGAKARLTDEGQAVLGKVIAAIRGVDA
ncbi:hypothetical protein [Antarcticirhabdus aurantiaca]|uniref:Uncharacterized protein n=1 Tax=Antarcticirhabdus aurantiaca TaxID=2606717 RepID=A0ACD4NKR5_9HYPH|nr:hypothetical protein [Antarcticirhabdus aurantiaca]WAJ27351.1 hypothetical protein OXU80_21240 [Jeongeuplla avenae]